MNDDELLIGEAARRLNIMESRLRRLIDLGTVPSKRVGRFRSIRIADLGAVRQILIKGGFLESGAPLSAVGGRPAL
jgi:excisionase family DNA binding protein